jgi:indolepyruvate ferredoxin oxidoreductase alpha subunit
MGDGAYLLSDEGEKHFLLGNEAIARGAIEAGVGLASTYPGTPSSEVGDALSEVAKSAGIYFEISTNEIVALEVAAASAMSGVRSFVFMKHVGMNVASDAMMSTAYIGTRAGLVIMTADDPSMFSSQNEQDNRHYSEMSRLPLIEPSNPQEAKDYLVYAFELSERAGCPVILRTTTRVSHMRATVSFGPRRSSVVSGDFRKDPSNTVILPATAYKLKTELLKRFENLEGIAETSPLNRIERYGSGVVGVITAGAAYNSLMDVVEAYGLEIEVLKLGFSNPLPEELVASFMRRHGTIVVVEELDPFLEEKVRAIVQMKGIPVSVRGKMDGHFPDGYEYNPDVVAAGLARIMGFKTREKETITLDESLPSRPPVMCPGCPHRATYYAVELVAKQLRLKTAIYPNDIGCYSLGVQKPFLEADYLLCMGSSVGTASGFAKVTDQQVIAFIGDSTFFHAGIPGLINAVHNNHKLVLIIMDNRTTAMTGLQPDPGVPLNSMGEDAQAVSIEDLVKGVGVRFVRTVDPYDTRSMMRVVREAAGFEGPSVVISRRECALMRDAELRRNNELVTYTVNQSKCVLCMNCVLNFACPAIYKDQDGLVRIDPDLCDGCGVCASPMVCGPKAIEVKA